MDRLTHGEIGSDGLALGDMTSLEEALAKFDEEKEEARRSRDHLFVHAVVYKAGPDLTFVSLGPDNIRSVGLMCVLCGGGVPDDEPCPGKFVFEKEDRL